MFNFNHHFKHQGTNIQHNTFQYNLNINRYIMSFFHQKTIDN